MHEHVCCLTAHVLQGDVDLLCGDPAHLMLADKVVKILHATWKAAHRQANANSSTKGSVKPVTYTITSTSVA